MNIKWSKDLKKFSAAMLAFLFIFMLGGCARLGGEFAFKNFFEDHYKKMDDPLAFEKSEKINWVYIFRDIRNPQNITVTLLKKEIVWVDVSSRSEQISALNNVINGKIENLPDGDYRIVISQFSRVIDRRDFGIYSDDKE